MFALAEQCFARHPILGRHLGYALLQGLEKHGTQNVVIDGKDNSELRFDKVLAASIALSKFIKAEAGEQRVGIVLPPCTAGLIANIAVLLAGKTPVNLNFTAGRASIESAIKQSDIDRFLTADTFVRKMQAFPWPPTKQLILMERLMPSLKGKATLWFILSKLLPASLLALFLGVPKRGGDKEALLLFTSGSSGEPKGVVLTHRNLVANVAQFGSRLNMTRTDTVLGSLPLFHSFGCTVTLWYPIICGLNLVYYPSPLEIKKLAELIEKHKISLMIATPTFLRGYLRGVNREQLASIKLCVTGAEKLPRAVAEAFENRFGKPVLEGYGLTETSPVSNVNLPDPEPVGDPAAHPALPACRHGSVGQLLPGMAVRITHVDSGERLPLHQAASSGSRAPTCSPATSTIRNAAPRCWIARAGSARAMLVAWTWMASSTSRAACHASPGSLVKMVPHETVEETIVRSLGLEGESTRRIAIVGVPDIEKGEALIMLTSVPGGPEHQEIVQLRYRLIDARRATAVDPKKMIRVTEIPVLASGKLDVKGCEKIAKAAS